ncbi:MAG: hypothetical protein V3U73_01105, partial [bacterium]
MKRRIQIKKLILILGVVSFLSANAALVLGSGVTVTTSGDVVDGITTSIANLIANQGADGKISLREAITAANNTAGLDTIKFNI